MAIQPNPRAARYLRTIFDQGIAASLTDRDLLERFAGRAGEASELAFAALVERHGPMVLGACRAALRDEHDAQDAFQAVFLVLVHKARSLWVQDSLGPWLHAVALRVAAGARASVALRRGHERRHAERTPRSVEDNAAEADELRAAVHEELGRLPDGYRKAIVLCDLEGLTHEEAARRLGWPVGTVKSRQGRGRERLRGRLARRGLAPTAGSIAAALAAGRAGAAVPAGLVDATVKVAALVSGGQAAGAVSATAALLVRAAIRAMLLARLRLAAGAAVVLCGVVATAGLAVHSGLAAPPQAGPATAKAEEPPPRRPALDDLRPEDIPPEKRLADLPPTTVAVLGEVRGRHAGEVRGLAMTPDGKTLATIADQDKMVRLWDAETLLPTGSLAGHRAFVECVAISPDGKWLASGGAYGDFFLWDLSVTPPRGPILLPTHGKDRKFNNLLRATAFSPNGNLLAVAGDAGGFELFDMTVEPPASRGLVSDLEQKARSLSFSPDGKTLAMAGLDDGSVRLFDVAGPIPREKAALRLPEREVTVNVPIAPRLGEARGPAPVVQKVEKHRTPLVAAAFSPDGRLLAVLDKAAHIQRWDVTVMPPAPRRRLMEQSWYGHVPAFDIRDRAMLAFSHDGRLIAASQLEGYIRIWDREGNERALVPGHKMRLTAGVFSPDDRTLITGGDDQVVRTWELMADAPREKRPPRGPIGDLGGIAFSPDATRLAVKDWGFVRLWDLTEARGLSRLDSPSSRLGEVGTMFAPLAFRPDGKSLFIGGSLREVDGPQPGRSLLARPLAGWPMDLSLSADGRTAASGGQDRKVHVWDLRAAEAVERLALDGDTQWLPAVALSPDGAYLAFAGPGHSIRIWVLAGLEPRERATIDGNGWPISALAFSPDGQTLAAGTNAGMRLWKVAAGKPEEAFPTKNGLGFSTARPINRSLGYSLAFTPDGKRLVAADEIADPAGRKPSRPAICVFDVATGERLHAWEMSVPCQSIAMAPDGRHVAAARRDGIALILRLPGPPASRGR